MRATNRRWTVRRMGRVSAVYFEIEIGNATLLADAKERLASTIAGDVGFATEIREPMWSAGSFEGVFRGIWCLLGHAGVSNTAPGVRPASHPCVREGSALSLAPPGPPFFWRRPSGEGPEDWGRGLSAPREMIENFFDHRRIFDARDAVRGCTNAAHAGCAGAATFMGPPQCSQVSMSTFNTRSKRWAHVIQTCGAGADSSVVSVPRRPRRAGVTCSRSR